MPAEPNASLIRDLKHTLSLAESGAITNAVIVAAGDDVFHRLWNIPKPADYPMMIGEVGLFQRELEFVVLGNRTEKLNKQPHLVAPGLARG